jgi:predicted outer membrane repeat protein
MRQVASLAVSMLVVTGIFLVNPSPAAAVANNIYVGSADHVAGGSCADPDFSTDPSDEGAIDVALSDAMLDVDDDGDVIIVCEGEYVYEADIVQHDGDPDYDVIVIRAETDAEVTLSGNEDSQLFNFVDMESVSISGIDFVDAQVTGSGAAIQIDGGSLSVSDCSFTGGVATVDGGAIFSYGGHVSVDNCDFTGNTSPSNGAIFVDSAPDGEGVSVSNSTFTNNSVGEGAAISVNGAVDFGDALISVTDSEFVNNDGNYGAINIDNGGVELTRVHMEGNDSDNDGGAVWAGEFLMVEDSEFRSNSADDGGAIWAAGDIQITNATFTENHATDEGGALYLDECLATSIDHNVFARNQADDSGGGAINFDCSDTTTEAQITNNRFERNVAADYGGATDDDGAKVLVYTRNTFVRNEAIGAGADGGAVWISNGRFYRNRFVGNRAAAYGGGIYIVGRSDNGTARRNSFASNRALRGAQYYNSR